MSKKERNTSPKTNMSRKRDYLSREYIFQPLIFRGHVSFQGSTCFSLSPFFIGFLLHVFFLFSEECSFVDKRNQLLKIFTRWFNLWPFCSPCWRSLNLWVRVTFSPTIPKRSQRITWYFIFARILLSPTKKPALEVKQTIKRMVQPGILDKILTEKQTI